MGALKYGPYYRNTALLIAGCLKSLQRCLFEEMLTLFVLNSRRASEEEAVRCPAIPSPCPMLGGKILRPLNRPRPQYFESGLRDIQGENIVERWDVDISIDDPAIHSLNLAESAKYSSDN